jgi:hypothetical protein
MASSREQILAFADSAGGEFKRLLARFNPYLDQARAWYQKREPREKILVQIAGALVSIFLIYNIIYLPIQSLRDGLKTSIETRQRDVIDVQRLVGNYQRLKTDLSVVEGRTVPKGKDFSLFSLLEGALSHSIGREKIGSITPSDKKISDELIQYTVDLKLTNVSLADLVTALYGVKTINPPVMVSNISIKKRFQDPHLYDVEMICSALGKNG